MSIFVSICRRLPLDEIPTGTEEETSEFCHEMYRGKVRKLALSGLGSLKWTVFIRVRNAVHRVKNTSVRVYCVKNASIHDNNVITPCYTAVIRRSYFPPGPSRCEHGSNTEVAEMHFTLDRRFRIDTVCLPGMLRGFPPNSVLLLC